MYEQQEETLRDFYNAIDGFQDSIADLEFMFMEAIALPVPKCVARILKKAWKLEEKLQALKDEIAEELLEEPEEPEEE